MGQVGIPAHLSGCTLCFMFIAMLQTEFRAKDNLTGGLFPAVSEKVSAVGLSSGPFNSCLVKRTQV